MRITLNTIFSNLKFRFNNNTDSNKLSGAHLYWTVLTAIVSKMFVLTIIKKGLFYITVGFI